MGLRTSPRSKKGAGSSPGWPVAFAHTPVHSAPRGPFSCCPLPWGGLFSRSARDPGSKCSYSPRVLLGSPSAMHGSGSQGHLPFMAPGQGVHSTPPALRHPLSPPQTPSRPSRLQGARAHAGPSGHTSFPSSLLEDLGILGVRVTQSLWDLSVGSQSCVLLCCYIYSEESVVLCPEVIRPLRSQ